ncbi:Ppx/GppA phosphatase family protein [Nocardioides marmorisolisilvae]|uniref:Ppx/GppA family phosphatase n=1 Tax=Nocardioides marmorisolisilvae TaxID=1542737 RepID=A0A3N0DZA6_9ACTN|nr:Ppx/GppA phosphatase family protein [Nocardioides marmorisolisilvae]RNL80934.1 Ppx/GppA family phosphatase [Nocardioides marmorisolisilvae]
MVRVAAFDCGTNSLRLLVADLDPSAGTATEHVREMRIVRLGQGVDRTGRIAEESMERAYAALDEYAMLVTEYQPDRIRFCATSAARDAENAADFTGAVRERIGVEVEVIGGDEEARASFDGATRALGPEAEAPVLVLDIGGGSTELILGTADGRVTAEHSLDIGSVRLTERHLHGDPPTAEQVAAVEADIDAALDSCRVDPGLAGTVVGVAGTVTTVAAGVLGLPAYDREQVHLATLEVDAVRATIGDLVAMTVADRRALGYMHPGRADVIGAGALILDRILRRTPVQTLTVSESDILDGIAWSCVT